MPLTIVETGKSLAYAPYYLLLDRLPFGAVTRLPQPPAGMAAKAVLEGTADLCVGGLMRVLKEYDTDPGNRLVCFADLVSRDAMVLVGRKAERSFALGDLADKRIGVYQETPTAWLALRHDLMTLGIVDEVDARPGTLDQNEAALRRGAIAAMQAPVELALRLQADGFDILANLGARGGEVHTCLYAHPARLNERHAEFANLAKALTLVLTDIRHMPPEAIGESIGRVEPDLINDQSVETLRRFQAMGVWAETPRIAVADYGRMKDALRSGGFIAADPAFDLLVDTSILSN